MAVRIISSPCTTEPGWLRDVSVSGAFVETALAVPLLTLVHLELKLQLPHGTEACELSGYVARHASEGIGIEWCELAPEGVVLLLSAESERRPEPTIPHRPLNAARGNVQPLSH
jgi:hypothetical protein